MDPLIDVTSLIDDILKKEQECEKEVKQRRHYEDTLNQLNADIESSKTKCEELQNEFNENQTLVIDLKCELIRLQIKHEAIKKVVNENRKTYEDGLKQLDEMCEKIWSNKEEFCDKVNVFIDKYGIAATKNKTDTLCAEEQYVIAELDNKIIQDEFCDEFDFDNTIGVVSDCRKNNTAINVVTPMDNVMENDVKSELKLRKSPCSDHFGCKNNLQTGSRMNQIDERLNIDSESFYGERETLKRKYSISSNISQIIHNQNIVKPKTQLPITNFFKAHKINKIDKEDDNIKPYNLVEILEPCSVSNIDQVPVQKNNFNDFNINKKSLYDNNITIKEGINNISKMYNEFMLVKDIKPKKKFYKNRFNRK